MQTLRRDPVLKDVPLIMLTVKREVKERVEGLNVGADDYLPKPVDDEELEARIFAALRSRQARNELRQRNVELERRDAAAKDLAKAERAAAKVVQFPESAQAGRAWSITGPSSWSAR